MSKYIIELKDDVQVVQKVGVTENGNAFVMNFYKDQLEELNSDYINEHYGQLQDDAYQRGLEDGKAVNDKGCEGCKYEGGTAERNPCISCSNYYQNYWVAKDDKIEVGDEVKPSYSDIAGVVTLVDGDTIYVLWRDGSSTSIIKLKDLCKTGRHFDIQSILEAMKS